MVQLGIRDDDAFDRDMANTGWNRAREAIQLLMDVRRRVQEEPALSIDTYCRGGLAPPKGFRGSVPAGPADWTPAVPLRKASTCSRAEENDVHVNSRRARLHGPLVPAQATGLRRRQ